MCGFVALDALPLCNQDDDERPPVASQAFRAQILAYDAVLFVTPEYNRSIPAPLKNALDVGSRPYGQSVWNGKPAAVASASPAATGGFGASQHLRQSLAGLNMPVMPQPELYIGHVDQLIDTDGRLADEPTARAGRLHARVCHMDRRQLAALITHRLAQRRAVT